VEQGNLQTLAKFLVMRCIDCQILHAAKKSQKLRKAIAFIREFDTMGITKHRVGTALREGRLVAFFVTGRFMHFRHYLAQAQCFSRICEQIRICENFLVIFWRSYLTPVVLVGKLI